MEEQTMADEKNMMPELTLTPDTTAAAEEAPTGA